MIFGDNPLSGENPGFPRKPGFWARVSGRGSEFGTFNWKRRLL